MRVAMGLIAYILLLIAVGLLSLQDKSSDLLFLTLWMVASVFSGIFGKWIVGLLVLSITGFTGWSIYSNSLDLEMIMRILLMGYLPVLVSFLLWHSKSNNEKTNERAYYDLANELNQVANKSDTVISAISDGVIAINNQGNIELINPAALRMTGWGKQDALNLDYKSVLQLLTRDGSVVDKSKDPVFEVLSANQPVKRNDLQLQTSSGKKISIELVVSPIGRIGSGAIIVFRDITKEQEEERAQAEFISTASHEMRTPVASIEGYLGLALNPATATIDEKAREYITKAHESAQHLGRLFQDLLDITKAEDGRLSNNPKVIDLVQFTSDIVEGLRHKAEEKKLRLFFKPVVQEPGGLKNLEPVYYLYVDADHLREVIANLVENAIKYTLEGEVVVDIKGDDTHAVVSIADSGIGIPAEDIPHLFQKFYRVDNSDTREIGGTGLGLYLCRRLVETMEGRIWVESEYKKGSTFFVELPRISHEEAQNLIEGTATEAVKPNIDNKYMDNKKIDPETEKRRREALNIPIIMNKKGTRNQPKPYKPPTSVQNAADTIIGNTASRNASLKERGNIKVVPPPQTTPPQKNATQPANTSTPSPSILPQPQATSTSQSQSPKQSPSTPLSVPQPAPQPVAPPTMSTTTHQSTTQSNANNPKTPVVASQPIITPTVTPNSTQAKLSSQNNAMTNPLIPHQPSPDPETTTIPTATPSTANEQSSNSELPLIPIVDEPKPVPKQAPPLTATSPVIPSNGSITQNNGVNQTGVNVGDQEKT